MLRRIYDFSGIMRTGGDNYIHYLFNNLNIQDISILTILFDSISLRSPVPGLVLYLFLDPRDVGPQGSHIILADSVDL